MVRVAVRATVGLLFALAAGLTLAPLLDSAAAQSPALVASRLPQTVPATTVIRATTTTTATTAPPLTSPVSTSSIPTTPTTRILRPRVTAPTTSTTAPPPTSTTSTTVAPLPAPAPPPVTLPLASTSQSGNISPFFSWLSGFGILCFAGLLTAQWLLTKPGRRGPTL